MGIVISLILVAFGAILTWAVNSSGGSVDPQAIGVILMVIGIIVFGISIALWRTWWGPGFWAWHDDGPPVARRRVPYARRRTTTTYVEDEPSPPPGP
jgi:hypothetical protein